MLTEARIEEIRLKVYGNYPNVKENEHAFARAIEKAIADQSPAALAGEREAFEAWAKTAYPNSNTPHNAWIVWQAALASRPTTQAPNPIGHAVVYEYCSDDKGEVSGDCWNAAHVHWATGYLATLKVGERISLYAGPVATQAPAEPALPLDRAALIRCRDGFISERATGQPCLENWRDETLRLIDAAIAAPTPVEALAPSDEQIMEATAHARRNFDLMTEPTAFITAVVRAAWRLSPPAVLVEPAAPRNFDSLLEDVIYKGLCDWHEAGGFPGDPEEVARLAMNLRCIIVEELPPFAAPSVPQGVTKQPDGSA